MAEARIYILYTGGTVGMAPKDESDPNSPLEPKPLSELVKYIPGSRTAVNDNKISQDILFELPNKNTIRIGSGGFERPVDSSDIKPKDWIKMAAMIEEVYDDYDGFIILHGTDTMAYTSSGLSFIFENLGKPVVITGSQLPICATRSDAVLNLVNAIHVAGYKATDLPLIPEVVIVFADKIIRGCRATKISTSNWAGFDSPNFPLLGTIGEYITINRNYLRRVPDPAKKFYLKADLVDDVLCLSLFPGLKAGQIDKLLMDDEIRGIVLNTYGTGNSPGEKEFNDAFGKAVDSVKIILSVTQCLNGMVEMGLYEASSELLELGVVSGLDMTTEAAIAKLMWTLGTQFGSGRITQLQIDQRGECRVPGFVRLASRADEIPNEQNPAHLPRPIRVLGYPAIPSLMAC